MKRPEEIIADKILSRELKDRRRNKATKREYSILSDSQIKRVSSTEIPFSSLSGNQRRMVRDNNEDLPEPD